MSMSLHPAFNVHPEITTSLNDTYSYSKPKEYSGHQHAL